LEETRVAKMTIRSDCNKAIQKRYGVPPKSRTPPWAEANLLRGAHGEKLLGLSAERASGASLRDLESKLCAECDRTVSKVVQILTEVRAIQIINRNSVIILIESIQEIGAHDELAPLVELDVLRKTEIGIVKPGSSIGVPAERSIAQAKI
jgi:hypothetical protein